jgi:predicted nucleotidyltransferase
LTKQLELPLVNITIFGSFARGDATAESDIDVAAVIPDDLSSEDVLWADAMDRWRRSAERLLGNQVNIIEASVTEVRRRLASGSGLWVEIMRHGVVMGGQPLSEL